MFYSPRLQGHDLLGHVFPVHVFLVNVFLVHATCNKTNYDEAIAFYTTDFKLYNWLKHGSKRYLSFTSCEIYSRANVSVL